MKTGNSTARALAAVLGLGLLVAACSSSGKPAAVQGDTLSAPVDDAAPEAPPPMNSRIRTGPIPADLDPRLAARDQPPLPTEALLEFQSIARFNPATNYRYVLARDGRLFYAAHSGTATDGRVLFDTPLPTAPTRTVATKVVMRIERSLRKSRFLAQAPYQIDPQVEDGSVYVVTARIDGGEHEVIYDGFAPPLVELLETLAIP